MPTGINFQVRLILAAWKLYNLTWVQDTPSELTNILVRYINW